ncbi:MAG: methylated-DNA--[protein]-cysteine S-methyltransferase [Christensenellales bacterium]|jgi:methylated-DNA-[protein]-cysteine S-methyltransferase
MYYTTTCPSPIGLITLACDRDGGSLVGLWIEGQKYHPDRTSITLAERDDLPIFDAAREWLERYFSGERPKALELPLAPVGSAFRRGVWDILCEIPYGEVVTYGDIARKMAEKLNKQSMSGQAVGGAVGHNPISIIIPCHRVVGASGSLTGYSAGISVKTKLLELEGVDMSRLFVPAKGTAL